jgi:Family of unknown function (DUF5682)
VARGAAWIEGFLSGGGLLLVHDQRLLKVVDGWLTGIAGEIVGRKCCPNIAVSRYRAYAIVSQCGRSNSRMR